jgi:hypothetical protein
MSIIVGLTLISTNLLADVNKGKIIYNKKLKSKCKISGKEFAEKHSQDEWEELNDAGRLSDEIKKSCHGFIINEKDLPHVYDFFYENANDS